MKRSILVKSLLILIVFSSLVLPTITSCFTIPNRITKIWASPYGKIACFIACTYLVARTIGYVMNDAEDFETEDDQENSWTNSPVKIACISSLVASITNVVAHGALTSWNNNDQTKFTSIEDKIQYCKPINELIGSPYKIATKIYKSIISRHKDKRPSTNWLLHGPPGCGKTDLAKAVARKLHEEIGADALFIKGSSFNTKYSGQGAEKVDALFKEAIKRTEDNTKPVIIIIDEIDALNSRDETDNGCGVSQSQTIDDLLSTLSDIKKQYKIYLIGTTNHKERVDKALQRRCAKPLEVKGLTKEEMKVFIKEKSKHYSIDPSITTSDILNLFDDIPIASFIEELFEEASDSAESNNRKKISLKDFERASEGYQEHYDSHDKKQPEIETQKELQRLNFIEQIKKSTGVSYIEAEDIFRKRTGYRGPRAYGSGGYASTALLTKSEEWEEEQRTNARNAEDRSTDEYEYRRDIQRQREKEAEKRSKESLALQKLNYLKGISFFLKPENFNPRGRYIKCAYNSKLKAEYPKQRKDAGFSWIDTASTEEES